MKIHFLGTNGWFDSATGNTTCTLIDSKTHYIILDAGFGIHKVQEYLKEDKPVYLFISHFHIDHICGLHALATLKVKKLTIFGQKTMKKYLKIFVNHPFAASFKEMKFPVILEELKPGTHEVPFDVKSLPLKHVDPAMGYRFTLEGKTIVYCADTAICPNDAELAKDADLLIHECAFMPGHTTNWGHTNPEQGAQLAKDSGVKKLVFTHLGADHYNSSEVRKSAEKVAQNIFPNTTVADDGLTIEI